MSVPGNAVQWQSLAIGLAILLAIVSGLAVVKSLREQDAQAADIKGWLTGGESYPYLEPLAFPEGIMYLVKHAGNKYPLYDVEVRLQDLDRGPRLPDGSVLPTKFFKVGTLTSNTDKFPVLDEDLRIPNPSADATEVRRFRVELPARNGLVLQDITLTAVNGHWQTNSYPIRKGTAELRPANFQEAQQQEPRRVQ
jgi:hypothetical protein